MSTTGPVTTSGVTTQDMLPSTGFDDGGTTDTEEPVCDDEGLYRAIWWPGGLDRVVVYRRDDLSGTCTWITLASPLESSSYDVPPNGGWAVEQALSNDVPGSCDGDDPSVAGATSLAGINGSIVVDRGGPGSACEVAVTAIAFTARPPTQRDRIEMCPEPVEIDGC